MRRLKLGFFIVLAIAIFEGGMLIERYLGMSLVQAQSPGPQPRGVSSKLSSNNQPINPPEWEYRVVIGKFEEGPIANGARRLIPSESLLKQIKPLASEGFEVVNISAVPVEHSSAEFAVLYALLRRPKTSNSQ